MSNTLSFLTIHGHFYQPPRENPWIEAIERQTSAAPFHNWNEKIAAECYTPNSVSRILDKQYRITDIVNNYSRISFNFGPTLLNWLQQQVPQTYRAILEADQQSQQQFSGHGNAIAQAYNHMILPLANQRDKITQVKWGLEDFKFRFKRDAESIWLPETAVNYPTIEVLIEHNIKFLILSPFQALRVRSLKKTGKWINVDAGKIDTTQPYRCFFINQQGKKNKDKYIDIFFYHAGLSKGVAFDHLLRDANNFVNKITDSFHTNQNQPQLISICTDGESYGHHEPFGDMGLAYLLYVEAERKGIRLTNFAKYLEQHPPQMEVELKSGPNGEGSSWSCIHGVGRWYRDCGCSTGGRQGWNQKWRWHLRNALDKLRDELIVIFDKQGAEYFHDPWHARDDYIHVIINRSDKSLTNFFNKHANKQLTEQQKSNTLSLLEMQRHSMLMYTSCGWFFADISGLETIQILKYAARALELSKKFVDSNLELMFLSELKKAKSNIKQMGNGKDIFINFVKPSIVSMAQIVNQYAILSSLEGDEDIKNIHHFNIVSNDYEKYTSPHQSLIIGNLEIKSNLTRERENYSFALLFRPDEKYECAVKSLSEIENYQQLKTQTHTIFRRYSDQFWNMATNLWGKKIYSISDLLYEDRERLYNMLLKETLENLQQEYLKIFQANKQNIFELNNLGIPIPIELRIPAEASLSFQLENEIQKSIHNFNFDKALEIVNLAEKLNLNLKKDGPQQRLQRLLEQQIKLLYETLDYQRCNRILQIIENISSLKLKINESTIQNYLFQILNEKLPPIIDEVITNDVVDSKYHLINSILLLAYNLNFNITNFKEKLKPLEKKLSENPEFWP